MSPVDSDHQLTSRRPSVRRGSAGLPPIGGQSSLLLKIPMEELAKEKIISFSGLITQATRNGRAGLADRLRDAQTTLIVYLRLKHAITTIIGSGGHVEFIPIGGAR